jgi:branched-chain amino acid transport system ATP-binding protein
VTGRAEASLRAIAVGVRFAGLEALSDVSLRLDRGEILGLIGPNGAGKTTLVNVLSGFQRPTAGRVLLGDRDITALPPQKLAAQGLGRTFQSVRLFGRLSVFDNVLAGAVPPASSPGRCSSG